MEFKIGDIVNAHNGSIQNAEIIDIFTINNVATISYYGRTSNVYFKNLVLVKHQPLYALKNKIKFQLSKIKHFIYRYNPLNYRIIHKDNIEVY